MGAADIIIMCILVSIISLGIGICFGLNIYEDIEKTINKGGDDY